MKVRGLWEVKSEIRIERKRNTIKISDLLYIDAANSWFIEHSHNKIYKRRLRKHNPMKHMPPNWVSFTCFGNFRVNLCVYTYKGTQYLFVHGRVYLLAHTIYLTKIQNE